MEYRFLAAINPAYRPFITKFFAEGGIEFMDEYMDNERAQAVFRELSPRKPKTRAEEMFCELIGRRKYDPQVVLESKGVLEMILGKLDEAKIGELSLLLPSDSGRKFVFTKEEVAERIAQFYTVDFRASLLSDFRDWDPRSLYKYVRSEDERQFPGTHPFGQDKYDESVRAWAEKLLLWINQVSPANVAQEISSVLAEHEATSYAYHKTELSYKGRVYSESCEHGSKYVKLSGSPGDDGMFNLWLRALRKPEYDEMDSGPYLTPPYYTVELQHG